MFWPRSSNIIAKLSIPHIRAVTLFRSCRCIFSPRRAFTTYTIHRFIKSNSCAPRARPRFKAEKLRERGLNINLSFSVDSDDGSFRAELRSKRSTMYPDSIIKTYISGSERMIVLQAIRLYVEKYQVVRRVVDFRFDIRLKSHRLFQALFQYGFTRL